MNSLDAPSVIDWFRLAAPYVNDLRGRTLVIAIPGEGLAHENFRNLVHDLALLSSLGTRLVLVFGARDQITSALSDAGIESAFHGDSRITDARTLEVVKAVVGRLRFDIEAAISQGLPNSPMAGAQLRVVSGNFVSAQPLGILDGVDLQWSGRVRRIDGDSLTSQLHGGNLVLVPPLGTSLTGEIFSVNYLELAEALAASLRAEKLILLRENGQLEVDGNNVRELPLARAEKLLQQSDSSSLRIAVKACNHGVPRVQMVSYSGNGALLEELLTRGGSGTMVYRDSYETVRRARIEDVGGILGLIRPLEKEGVLVRRSRKKLEGEISHFTIFEVDSSIVACAALYPITDQAGSTVAAELACVAIHPDFRGGGRGARLMRHLERQARSQGVEELFVLTTQTEHWFIEQGFAPVAPESLPASRQALYNDLRQSRVMRKALV